MLIRLLGAIRLEGRRATRVVFHVIYVGYTITCLKIVDIRIVRSVAMEPCHL